MSEIEYNDLLFEISEKVADFLLPRLVFMCRGKISNEDNVRDVLTLFKELEGRNYLGIDRLDTLKGILTQSRKRPLLKKVEEFERRRKAQSVGIVSSLKEAASHLKGAIKFVCSFHTIAGGILVATSGRALRSCSSLEEFVEVFNNVVLVSYTKLVKISEGSLCFTVQAETPAALRELWDTYKDGTLQRRLQEFLVTDDIKQTTNEDDIEMTVFIDEQEYLMSFNFLQSQVLDKKDECCRRNSDSFLDINSNQREITLMKLKQVENKLSIERQVYGEEMKKLQEKIFLAREPRAPSVKQEELRGRRTRRKSDSFLYFKPNEVELVLMNLIKQAEELRKEKQILESKIAELEKTLRAERTSNINQTMILERPLEKQSRNSDSDLHFKARKEGFEQTENQPEEAFGSGAQMDLDKRMFVENYLQNILETHSVITETSDSGIKTYGATSEIEMQDISDNYFILVVACQSLKA